MEIFDTYFIFLLKTNCDIKIDTKAFGMGLSLITKIHIAPVFAYVFLLPIYFSFSY